MKIFNFALGMFFGAWAIGTLVLGIQAMATPATTTAGLYELSTSAGAFAMLALCSMWSFQIAMRKTTTQSVAA